MNSEHNTLTTRVAVVTGASAGIGDAVARHLAECDVSVVVNARRKERLDQLVSAITEQGGRAIAVAGDCADQTVVDAMLDAAEDTFSKPADLVVINAGRGLAGSVMTTDESQWEDMIRTNVTAAARLLRSAAKRMLDAIDANNPLARPHDIVLLGSNVGKHISPFSSMYGSTKFALGAIAEGARRELGPQGIRVSLVCPGIVKSEFQKVAGYDEDWARDFFAKFDPVLEPIDVACTIGFIASQPPHVHINDVVLRPTRQDYP